MASEYRLVSYAEGGVAPKAGVLVGERVVPAATLLQGADGIDSSSVLGLLRAWDSAHPRLHTAAQKVQPNDGIALAQVKLLAPILYPGMLFCAGANYWDQSTQKYCAPGFEFRLAQAGFSGSFGGLLGAGPTW